MIKNILIVVLFLISLSVKSQTIDSISAKDAAKYYDKPVKVYGTVSGGRWLQQSKITLLNIDGEFPNHALVVMIKDDIRSIFKYEPETFLKGKKVVISGTIIKYRDKPEIIIASEKDITFLKGT